MTNPMFDLPPEDPERRPRRSPQQDEAQFMEQFIYLLTAPYIDWPGWEDLMLKHKDDILLYRLGYAREIFDEEMCTELEAMLYVSTVSLAHPLSHDWPEIYGWLFTRWHPEQGKDIWGEVRELDPNQVEQLNGLRRWIFRTQLNHLKGGQRQANRQEVEEEKQRLEAQQPQMFELPEEEAEGE